MGFHSFTGNDYCSAFFGKGKQTCWKIMIKNRNSYVFFRTWRRLDPRKIMIKNRNSYVFFRTWRRLDPRRRYYEVSVWQSPCKKVDLRY